MESDILSAWKEIQKSEDSLDYINFLNLYSFIEGKFGTLESKDILKEAFIKLQQFFLKFIQNDDKSRILSILETLAIKLSTSKSPDTLGYASSLLYDLGKFSLDSKRFELSSWFTEKSIFFCIIGKLFSSVYAFANVMSANAWLAMNKPDTSLNFSKIAIHYCEEALQKSSDEVNELQKCLFLSYYAYGQGLKKLGNLEQAHMWFEKGKKLSKLRPGISEDTEIALKIVKLTSKLKKTSPTLNRGASQQAIRVRPGLKKPSQAHARIFSKTKQFARPSTVYKVEPYTMKNFRIRDPHRRFIETFETSSNQSSKNLQTMIVFPKVEDPKTLLNQTFSPISQKSEIPSAKSSSKTSQISSEPVKFKDAERAILKRPILQLTYPKSHKITPDEFEKILVMKEKAYFMYVQCDFSFYYTKQSKIITTSVYFNGKNYLLDYKINSDKGLTSIISEDILPYLDLANDKLVIGQLVKINFIEGYFYINEFSGLLKFTIQQPRSNFHAEAYSNNTVLSCLTPITNFTEKLNINFFDIPREKFLTFYTIEEKVLKLDFPINDEVELLFFNKELTVFDNEYYFKISSINFLNDQKFLIESINASTKKISYCVVNKQYLKSMHKIEEVITGRNIDLLVKILTVKFGQVKLHLKTKESNIPKALTLSNQIRRKRVTRLQSLYRGYSVRKANGVSKGITIYLRPGKLTSVLSFIYSTEEKTLKLSLFHKQLEYSLSLKAPIPFPIPYFKYLYKNVKLDHFPILRVGKEYEKFQIVYKDFINSHDLIFNRLIFRTGLSINLKHYIVSMSLSKSFLNEIILVFKLQYNVFSDSISIITIDLDTISDKTEIPKQNLIAIGYYVAKYMLVVKGPDLLYIDLSKSKIDLMNYAQKIQSNFRGYWARKTLPKIMEKKTLLIKKKICIKGENWTVLFYERENDLLVFLVQGIMVLRSVLDKNIIEAHSTLSGMNSYIAKSIIPSIDVKNVAGALVISGVESLMRFSG